MLEFSKIQHGRRLHVGFVGEVRGTTHEGQFMVAVSCKKFL